MQAKRSHRWRLDPLSVIAILLLIVGLAVFSYSRLSLGAGAAEQEIPLGNAQSDPQPSKADSKEAANADLGREVTGGEATVGVVPSGKIIVHVTGQVANPGVVELESGARAIDAVEAAGGLLEDAQLDSVNLAQKVVDEQHLHISSIAEAATPAPTGGTAPSGGTGPSGGTAPTGPACVDLNAASAADLEQLDGIGPALAQRIVDHRDKNGSFESPESLVEVSGIGTKKLRGVIDELCP